VGKSIEPVKPTPLESMKNGAKRAGESTRTAWHKTVDALTPGDSSKEREPRTARREVRPPFWKRMMGKDDSSRGAETVPEFMAQQRLSP
jgi:hypothetical protein